jgi:ABC-type transporter Mla subunit MlaD
VESRQDFIVGISVVTAVGIVIGAFIATSGLGQRRYDVFLRVASAEGVSVDSRVILQGLEVGRVRSVSPRVDPVTRAVSFVARLSIAEQFADGARLQLPIGTRAELVQVSQISPAVEVRLLLPDTVGRMSSVLAAGDTLTATRRGSALEGLTRVADELSTEVREVLRQTHRTLVRVQGTLTEVDQTVRAAAPDVDTTLANVARTMERVNTLVASLERQALPDSLGAALARTNRLLLRLDTLTGTANSVTTAHRAAVGETLENLNLLTRQLNHFAAEITRRPYRVLTGVKPYAAESLPPAARREVATDSAAGRRP